ncbi:hypothetical protein CG710_000065 [Lachnotalea glycerini]|uniref:Uncharacterized protein n=1 Tax=Lachnotalea glycerini TaxID=1763509 RepID=A0A371JJU1_9FIRM|nr:hypothetical protein CG710_000065 [Lachnotalea glycerini]
MAPKARAEFSANLVRRTKQTQGKAASGSIESRMVNRTERKKHLTIGKPKAPAEFSANLVRRTKQTQGEAECEHSLDLSAELK